MFVVDITAAQISDYNEEAFFWDSNGKERPLMPQDGWAVLVTFHFFIFLVTQ